MLLVAVNRAFPGQLLMTSGLLRSWYTKSTGLSGYLINSGDIFKLLLLFSTSGGFFILWCYFPQYIGTWSYVGHSNSAVINAQCCKSPYQGSNKIKLLKMVVTSSRELPLSHMFPVWLTSDLKRTITQSLNFSSCVRVCVRARARVCNHSVIEAYVTG